MFFFRFGSTFVTFKTSVPGPAVDRTEGVVGENDKVGAVPEYLNNYL